MFLLVEPVDLKILLQTWLFFIVVQEKFHSLPVYCGFEDIDIQ